MDPMVEAGIVELRREHPGWGPRTLEYPRSIGMTELGVAASLGHLGVEDPARWSAVAPRRPRAEAGGASAYARVPGFVRRVSRRSGPIESYIIHFDWRPVTALRHRNSQVFS